MPERGGPQTVDHLLSDVLERIRRLEVHRHGFLEEESAARGGKEYATVVVAASNTHLSGRRTADIVCSGAQDNEAILAAINLLPSGVGGRVLLLEGTYNTSAEIFSTLDRVEVAGMGPGTLLVSTHEDNAFRLDGDFVRLRDLRIDCSDLTDTGIRAGGEDVLIQGVWVTRATDRGFMTTGLNVQIADCRAHDCERGFGPGSSFTVLSNCNATNCVVAGFVIFGNHVDLVGCHANNCGDGFDLDADNTVAGCTAEGCTGIGFIAGNSFLSACRASGNGGVGIAASNGSAVIGCEIEGVTSATVSGLTVVSECVVIGNRLDSGGGHGIAITGNDNVVSNNLVTRWGQQANITYDGINLTSADRNNVQGNTVRHGGTANRHRYGINVSNAASDDNLVTNNDLLNSATTGSLNNAGTGTVTAAGNRL